MSAITPADYLAIEDASPVRREYVSGFVSALAPSTVGHSAIGANIIGAFGQRLRDSPHRVYNCLALVHLQHGTDERFYYPDDSVAGPTEQPDSRAIENPIVIFEVLSASTDRVDRFEKTDTYLRCPSLKALVLVASERMEVILHERIEGDWRVTIYTEQSDTLPLTSPACELPLSEIYRG